MCRIAFASNILSVENSDYVPNAYCVCSLLVFLKSVDNTDGKTWTIKDSQLHASVLWSLRMPVVGLPNGCVSL